jgi:tetratricopeptide (TPR) repeat protein
MPKAVRICLALVAIAAFGPSVVQAEESDGSGLFVPRRPATRQQLNRREAVELYARGLICQRDDQLLEALRCFERARALDPDAAPVHKALIPLYQAIERRADALAACLKVVNLDPQDYETWFLYARLLQAQGRHPEARRAMARGVACPGLQERPELQQEMYFQLGVLYEGARDFARSAAAFRQAARILEKPEVLQEMGPVDPREVEARVADLYERIGRLAVQGKKYDVAVAAFLKARARSRQGGGRLNYNLAEVYRAQGKFRQALTSVNAYLALQPQGMEAYELKIALLRQLKRPEAAILEELQVHVQRDRFNVGLRLLLARQYQAAGQFDEAESIYKQLTDGTPNPDVYRGLFHLYLENPRRGIEKVLRELDETFRQAGRRGDKAGRSGAAARARVMVGVLKDDAELVKPLLKAAGESLQASRSLEYETCRMLAVLAGRAHQLGEAERLYVKCLEHIERDNEAMIYGGLLQVLWEGRKYERIEDVCRRGLKGASPHLHILFHLDLARALPFLDKMDEAVRHADKAVALAVDDSRLPVRLRRVGVLTLAERYDQAIRECQALFKEFPQPADVHDIRYMLSNVYSASRDFKRAEAELERLIKSNPDDPTPYNDLGYNWADRNEHLEKAEEYIRKAIDLDRKQKKQNHVQGTEDGRDNAAYIDSLGWVLFRRGRFEEARRELAKAAALPDGDDDPVVWDHLGDVYARLGQPARARAAWKKAVTLYEVERRRKMDQRYKDIKQKLKTMDREAQP